MKQECIIGSAVLASPSEVDKSDTTGQLIKGPSRPCDRILFMWRGKSLG